MLGLRIRNRIFTSVQLSNRSSGSREVLLMLALAFTSAILQVLGTPNVVEAAYVNWSIDSVSPSPAAMNSTVFMVDPNVKTTKRWN